MSVVNKSKQKQINLNEDYALTADSMNIVLLVQTKDKGQRWELYRELSSIGLLFVCRGLY